MAGQDGLIPLIRLVLELESRQEVGLPAHQSAVTHASGSQASLFFRGGFVASAVGTTTVGPFSCTTLTQLVFPWVRLQSIALKTGAFIDVLPPHAAAPSRAAAPRLPSIPRRR